MKTNRQMKQAFNRYAEKRKACGVWHNVDISNKPKKAAKGV